NYVKARIQSRQVSIITRYSHASKFWSVGVVSAKPLRIRWIANVYDLDSATTFRDRPRFRHIGTLARNRDALGPPAANRITPHTFESGWRVADVDDLEPAALGSVIEFRPGCFGDV